MRLPSSPHQFSFNNVAPDDQIEFFVYGTLLRAQKRAA